MKRTTSILIAGLFIPAAGNGGRIEGEVGTPMQPNAPYRVHDGSRPLPPMVTTAGAVKVAPPSDATVLFDGGKLDAWTTAGGDPVWEVRDGVIVATAGGDIQTRDEFGAVQLHLEWRVPAGYQVSDQGGNSGVFMMGRYEIQILESHGTVTYADGQAAALYGQQPPLANATAPQGEWQSYDIIFVPPVYHDGALQTPAIATVIHNGVIVQHAEPFLGTTRFREVACYPAEHPEQGPIRLQYHDDPVEFRNLWVRPLGRRDQRAD
jgi:hypothetical protein